MKISVLAVGRLGRTPEAVLAGDYLKRATASGRALGLGPFELVEVEGRRAGKAAEAAALLAAAAPGSHRIALDERGQACTSRAFADRIGNLRDTGARRVEFLIGGADGLDPVLRDEVPDLMAFGPQTWPHALVRLMLAEQLYRSVTILAGSPYHRD